MTNLEIGRILRASTVGFAVGCRVSQLEAPAFGSLVKAQPVDTREAIYGLIYDMHIDDDPAGAPPGAGRKLPAPAHQRPARKPDAAIEMSVLAVGYQVQWANPPRPAAAPAAQPGPGGTGARPGGNSRLHRQLGLFAPDLARQTAATCPLTNCSWPTSPTSTSCAARTRLGHWP